MIKITENFDEYNFVCFEDEYSQFCIVENNTRMALVNLTDVKIFLLYYFSFV